ncbi:fimbrial protein [Klebsiella sp. PL-2018]|uniref:fimbrial protein n=1 Tax=Klebsiella sp. PL-2018 TaxID=2851540 RepID=UPI001C23640F|nr:fimbrial protein [Klebsiella sp. PL-2018]QXD01097.1 Putative fimbrial componenet [Klebsiella sp. PL-2018]
MKKIIRIVAWSFLAFVGVCGYARADGTWVNCNRTNGVYQYFSSTTILVGKDAVVGDLLGGWMTSSNPTAWTCNHVSRYQSYTVGMTAQADPPYVAVGSTQVDGQTYTIYDTTHKPGLGYIARWRYTIRGQTSDWFPLRGKIPGTYETPGPFYNVNYDSSNPTWNIGLDVQVRLVKTTKSLTAGPVVSAIDPIYVRHYQKYGLSYFPGGGSYIIAQNPLGGVNIVTGGTCTTSDVKVNLPPAARSEFTGVGYTTARTDFNLLFSKCPAGLSSISYLFTPTTAIIDNANGVFALSSTSMASGVGIQLLNDQNIPLSFNTAYLLTDYDPGQDNATYTLPLRAGLYQTAKNVSSGDVSGAVTFTLVYK